MTRTTIAVVMAATLLAGGCMSDRPRSPGAKDRPPPTLVTTPPAPVATGRPAPSVAEFDRDPCGVASADELRAALAEPYNLLAANTIRRDGQPSPSIGSEGDAGAVGCGYRFVAPNDVAEAYHWVVVRVTRWASGGPALMTACRRAATAQPQRYRAVRLGDEACLGPKAILPMRTGRAYYTIAVTAGPGAAGLADEDVSLGAMSLAAAGVVADRLPGR